MLNKKKDWLIVFDMDGTLLPHTTACQTIAAVANKSPIVLDLEQKYADGLIDSVSFAEAALASWIDAGPNVYHLAFEMAVKINGIKRSVDALKKINAASCLVSMAPLAFAQNFSEFDFIFASDFDRGQILNPQDKPRIVEQLRKELGVTLERVVAFGDSSSDVPLFRVLSQTVAVNASAELEALSQYRYRGDDLFEALKLALPEL